MVRILMMLLACAPMAAFGDGDPEAGQQKAAACAGCHGMDGNSEVAMWPKLAGQHQDYATRQSILIREQTRNVPAMYPVVMDLSDQDLADIAAWYEQQSIEAGVADEALVEQGKTLYQSGDPDSGVPACSACHGPSGSGVPGAQFPKLRAQHADYTASRLQAYRDGDHHGEDDPSQIMVTIAEGLTDEEIEAVSSYIEGLHMARW